MGKALISAGGSGDKTMPWVLDGFVSKTQSSTVSNVLKLNHIVTADYPECWVIFSMNDSDNNNDNFCTVNKGNLMAVVGKRTYGSSDFTTWKNNFNTLTGFNIAPPNYPFTYNFTWYFYKKNITAGTEIEIQKNQYGRDVFMAVIGGGNENGFIPIWVYKS